MTHISVAPRELLADRAYVELRDRATGDREDVPVDEIIDRVAVTFGLS